MAKTRILLGSGGFSTDERRAGWIRELDDFLGPSRGALFIPYALADHDKYLQMMVARGFHAGRELKGIHTAGDPVAAVLEADAIYVGGGNTFRLLTELYRLGLLDPVRRRVLGDGVPYIGISAGTNVSGPTIKTTNDMPIVHPPSLDSLALVPFQVNPHYFAGSIFYKRDEELLQYGGETRDDRIREYHEMNGLPVVALWEGAYLRKEGDALTLGGSVGARLFRRGQAPEDVASGGSLPRWLLP